MECSKPYWYLDPRDPRMCLIGNKKLTRKWGNMSVMAVKFSHAVSSLGHWFVHQKWHPKWGNPSVIAVKSSLAAFFHAYSIAHRYCMRLSHNTNCMWFFRFMGILHASSEETSCHKILHMSCCTVDQCICDIRPLSVRTWTDVKTLRTDVD